MPSRKKREHVHLNQAGHRGSEPQHCSATLKMGIKMVKRNFLSFPFRHLGPVLFLPFQHPARILLRQLTNPIQRLEFPGAQYHFRGFQVVLELIDGFGPDNHRGDRLLRQNPCQGDPGDGDATLFRHGPHGIDTAEGPLLVHHGKVELAAPAVSRPALLWPRSAGKLSPRWQWRGYFGTPR